jgi:soluble lytic murein transglycosylase-like protein
MSEVSAAVDSATIRRLNCWVPAKEELGIYLPMVQDLLKTLHEETSSAGKLDAGYYHLFQNVILATAWQESCWSQFIRRGNKIIPLKSRAGSVGLMQVNQYVWRGVYDIRGLRGDIAYNGRAGCEILLHYLTDYALAQGEHQHSGGIGNLARATYAIYNGGPAHISRYRKPGVNKTLAKIDVQWWEKYQTVTEGKTMKVLECYE